MRFTTRIKVSLSLVPLSIAIIYLTVAYLAVYEKEVLDWLGGYFLRSYVDQHQKQHKKILKQIESGDVKSAAKNLEYLEDILKGDRAYQNKRNLLMELVKELHEQKRYGEMMEWSKRWLDLDDRDITAHGILLRSLEEYTRQV